MNHQEKSSPSVAKAEEARETQDIQNEYLVGILIIFK